MVTGIFKSDNCYIYYFGQESQRRNGIVLIIKKRIQNAVLGYNLKNDLMWSAHQYSGESIIKFIFLCSLWTKLIKFRPTSLIWDLSHLV